MGIRSLPFFKGKKGWQFAGGGQADGGGGGGGESYTLPVASANVLGGVKIGSGLNITNDGTLSASGGSGGGGSFDYSTTEFDTGQKWIDGKKIYGVVQNATRFTSDSTMCRFEPGVVDTFIGGFGLFRNSDFTYTSIKMMFDHRSGSWRYLYAYFSEDPGTATQSIICSFYTKL